jgi:Lar family restriction alleviation protein
MEQKILECPFCGSNDVALETDSWQGCHTVEYRHNVYCDGCNAEGPTSNKINEAIDKWNTLNFKRYEDRFNEIEKVYNILFKLETNKTIAKLKALRKK